MRVFSFSIKKTSSSVENFRSDSLLIWQKLACQNTNEYSTHFKTNILDCFKLTLFEMFTRLIKNLALCSQITRNYGKLPAESTKTQSYPKLQMLFKNKTNVIKISDIQFNPKFSKIKSVKIRNLIKSLK